MRNKLTTGLIAAAMLTLLAACNPYKSIYDFSSNKDQLMFNLYKDRLKSCEEIQPLKIQYAQDDAIALKQVTKGENQCYILITDKDAKYLCELYKFKNRINLNQRPLENLEYCDSSSVLADEMGSIGLDLDVFSEDRPNLDEVIALSKQCEYSQINVNYEWIMPNGEVGIPFATTVKYEQSNGECRIRSAVITDDIDNIYGAAYDCDTSLLDELVFDDKGAINLGYSEYTLTGFQSTLCNPLP